MATVWRGKGMEIAHGEFGSLADVIECLIHDEAVRGAFAADRCAFAATLPLPAEERKMVERLTTEVLAAFASSPDSRIDGGVAVWHGAESPLGR